MFDTNNIFSTSNTTAFDFNDLLSKFITAQSDRSDRPEPTAEYDWKSAYLTLKEDFDSYRKRMENAKKMEKSNLTKEIVRGFLEVVDYALFTYKAKNSKGTYTKEDEMVLDKLSDFLKAYNVYPMKDPTGHQFDHNYHEAVISDNSGIFEKNTVTMVISHGYMIGDEVLRHAKVAVSSI